MRVLQICSKPPIPAVDGGCKAMNNITQGLIQAGIEVKVLTLATQKHPFQPDLMGEAYMKKTGIEHVFIDTQVKVKDAFLNLFSSNSYNIERFDAPEFEALIAQTLQAAVYDAVILESLYVTPYLEIIRKHSEARVLYRAHNVEFEIWQRNAMLEKGPKRSYLRLLSSRLKKYESDIINRVDAIAAITSKDQDLLKELGATKPVTVVPFGINVSNYEPQSAEYPNSCFHIGSMDWSPNLNGINWLLKQVWPGLQDDSQNAGFYLAGRNMPEELLRLKQKQVHVIGEVEEANEFMNAHDMMLVPLFAGSGMRIKIVEAMALQKTVVATSIAAEGIDVVDGEHILIADTAEEFMTQIRYLWEHPEEKERIARNARELIVSNYDNQRIVNNLVQYIKALN
ncbi:MAG: glycosyltransferase [Flavobacteriales bacterium]|nr:glycosyltransferase [Flavobacteriales bacterium]